MCCDMGRTVCIDLVRYREKREGERRELYMRSVPLTTSPASGQLYIYIQQSDGYMMRVMLS